MDVSDKSHCKSSYFYTLQPLNNDQSHLMTLKTRDWKTRDHKIYEGGKRRIGKQGTKFAGVEKAGQACMEREMTKNRKFSLIHNPVV